MACTISIFALGPLITNGKLNYSLSIRVNLIALCLALVALLFIVVYQLLIKNTSAFISSLNLYVQVIWSTMLGIILFSERLNLNLILGAVLIIIGVFLTTSYQYIRTAKRKIWI
jgi:drug/metabolite transporter (DMT)-like permease